MSNRIPFTCPDIDKVIKAIKRAHSVAYDGMKAFSGHESSSYFDEIESELYGLTDKMEELRESNSKLRDLATDMENLVDELEGQINQMNTDIGN